VLSATESCAPTMAGTGFPREGHPTGFPQSPSAFDGDSRVSFSRLDNKFILETDEGNEYEWDGDLKRWVPVVGFYLAHPSV
jgi:hypothetical protein